MKVKDYAAAHNVTPQAVYQRLGRLKKRTGKPLSYYVEGNTGELTGEAVEILDKLYSGANVIKEIPTKTVDDEINALKQQLNHVESENARLQELLKLREEQNAQLHEQIDELRKDKEHLRQSETALIASIQPKQSFFQRLFNRKPALTSPDADAKKSSDAGSGDPGKGN